MNALTLSATRRRKPIVILTGPSLEAQYSTPIRARLSRALSMAWRWTRCVCTPRRIARTRAASPVMQLSEATAKKSAKTLADTDAARYLCSALHLKQATSSPTATAAGLFYGRGSCHNTSSVPCGALMRPLPVSRCNATGSGTFSVSNPAENINTISFI